MVVGAGHVCGRLQWGRPALLGLVAVFPEPGSDAGQATLNSSAGFIVLAEDGVRPGSAPRHEDFVSAGHGADAGRTDKPLSGVSEEKPAGVGGHLLAGASLCHGLNAD